VVEHALTALSEETKKEVEEILRKDSYVPFLQLVRILKEKAKLQYYYNGITRKSLAATVLCAASALYEWDKARETLLSGPEKALLSLAEVAGNLVSEDGDR
jgi:hypothetical protein